MRTLTQCVDLRTLQLDPRLNQVRGEDVAGEQEVVVVGTGWKGWDAWSERAPTFAEVQMKASPNSRPRTAESKANEVNEASNILNEALRANWGPIAQNGRLHDRASYRYYWTVLQRAKLAGLGLPEAAAALLNALPTSTTEN